MSNIKLSGNPSGSGSLTIAAPNTNSDLTLNLPTTLGSNGTSALVSTDALGNLGLGVTPSAWRGGYKAIDVQFGAIANTSVGSVDVAVTQNAFFNGTNWITKYTGQSKRQVLSDAGFAWHLGASQTAGNAISFTQAMTLDSSGNLLVGTTTSGYTSQRGFTLAGTDNASYVSIGHANGVASGNSYVLFSYNGSIIGSIAQSGTTNVLYNTSSDYRLKENIQPMTGALAKVAALKPCTYKWKSDGSDGQGFIAHELAAVVPQCVTGEKDAVDAEGKPVYQGIDTSFLVATLTAALQEQQAIITALTARIEVLEGK